MNRRQRKKLPIQAAPMAAKDEERKQMRITIDALSSMRQRSSKAKLTELQLYKPYEPMPGVLPAKRNGASIAMDAGFAFDSFSDLSLLGDINQAIGEGYAFPGFQVLAQWSQIPEFRRPAEIYAREMTRKWIKFQAVGEMDKTDRIAAIDKEFKRLNVQAIFRQAIEHDGLFGRGHIFIDTGLIQDDMNSDELKTELIESPSKVGKNSIKRLTVVEPMWLYPNRYNANNPIDPTFYRPISWFCMGKEIHSSRMLTVVTRPLADVLKPAYAFAGLSLSQMIKPYVDNWLRTRQSVSDLIHSFTVWVLSTDMSSITNAGAAQDFYNRLELFNLARDNHGINAINKDTETFGNVSVGLGGLDKLQAQSQEQMSAPTGIPLVYATGITPAGLNSTSEGEIEVFQDTLASNQEIYTPTISKILNLVMLSLFGEIDPDIGFEWCKLKVVTAKEIAEIRKLEAETDIAHIDSGVLDPSEVRHNIANEEDSRYSGLDLNKEITPPEDPSKDTEMSDFHESIGSN